MAPVATRRHQVTQSPGHPVTRSPSHQVALLSVPKGRRQERLFRFLLSQRRLGYHWEMKRHQQIDARGLALARCVVEHIEADPARQGLEKARQTCRHWLRVLPESQHACVLEWTDILERPWSDIRSVLLDPGECGNRLRQNSPFCGVLSNRERWTILREFEANESRAA
ncbi:MAG: hypothetical protein ACI9X0_002820 [Kiritimatiellia bacterium]